MTPEIAFLYHIYKPGDTIYDGYIGVTTRPEDRKFEHFSKLKSKTHKNSTLQENFDDSYMFKILLISTTKHCYFMENILRPKRNMGLNIAPGGNISHFSIETKEQLADRINKATNTKKLKSINTGSVYNEGTLERILDPITGTHSFIKKNRIGLMGNEFTSESASDLAQKRAKLGELPGQMRAKAGTHHWQTEAHVKSVSDRNSEIFRNTVTVTNKQGVSSRIDSEYFKMQNIGDIVDREYVGISSKESIRRKKICQ